MLKFRMVWTRGLTVVVLVGVGVATACSGRSTSHGGATGGTGGGIGTGAAGGTGGATGGTGGTGGATGGTSTGGRNAAGGGGRAGAGSAGRATAGFSGSAGRGGVGGIAGNDAGSCPATASDFCGSLSFDDCPEVTPEVGFRFECPLDATDATYEECANGYVRFTWQVGFENDVTVVYNDEGTLVAGYSASFDGPTCQIGKPRALSGCRSCNICGVNQNQAGGGGEGGDPGSTTCRVSDDGVLSLP